MKNIRVGLIAVLALTLGMTGCTYRQALVLAKNAAALNVAFEQGVTAANHDGFVDKTAEDRLLRTSRLIAEEDDAAITAITNQHDKAGAIAHIDQAIADVDTALTSDLLGVKNADRQNSLHAVLLSLRGLLVTAKALLS